MLLAKKYGVSGLKSLQRFTAHPTEWKALFSQYYASIEDEAKHMILRVFFGGRPKDGNPMLWGLVNDMSILRETVLQAEEHAHLQGMFTARPRPDITRFAYAIFAAEDGFMEDLRKRVEVRFPYVNISALMFDGFVLHTSRPTATFEDELLHILMSFSNECGVMAVVKPWATPMEAVPPSLP